MSSLRHPLIFCVALILISCGKPDLRSKAEAGDPVAQYEVGIMYANGRGVTQNNIEAVKWWRKSADQGHAAAQYKLGTSCHIGDGTPLDYMEAAKWYGKAAFQGHFDAQKYLGIMYLNGLGVPQDRITSEKWFGEWAKKAAPKDFYELAELLGGEVIFLEAPNVPQNSQLAAKWYLHAALLGHVPAQRELGVLYSKGVGVPINLEEAYSWLNLASVEDEDSKTKCYELERRLAPAILARAQRRSTTLHQEIEARKNAAGR